MNNNILNFLNLRIDKNSDKILYITKTYSIANMYKKQKQDNYNYYIAEYDIPKKVYGLRYNKYIFIEEV